jgi:hypothetical protein
MAYYAPLPLVVAVAVVLAAQRGRARALAAGAATVLVVAVFVLAWDQAAVVREFYAFTDRGSLRGLDLVARNLRPGEVVVTDRCWSFQAPWLLHTPTLAALDPADIQPKAEAPRARLAAAILDATPAGLAATRRLHVRYLIIDPTCESAAGQPQAPPLQGRPAYASDRLAVFVVPPKLRGR